MEVNFFFFFRCKNQNLVCWLVVFIENSVEKSFNTSALSGQKNLQSYILSSRILGTKIHIFTKIIIWKHFPFFQQTKKSKNHQNSANLFFYKITKKSSKKVLENEILLNYWCSFQVEEMQEKHQYFNQFKWQFSAGTKWNDGPTIFQ